MRKKMSALLVGAGGISPSWLKHIVLRNDVEITAVADPCKDNAMRRIGEFKLDKAEYYSSVDEALAARKFDMMFDCSIPPAHYGNALKALENGCHVLSEKPATESTSQLLEIIKAAKRAGKIHAVIQNRRYLDGIITYKDAVRKKLGRLTTLNADFYIGAHFGGFRDVMKHVLLLDMAIHSFDQARMISGCDPVKVFCKEWNPAGSWYQQDASAVAVFTMSDNVVFTYRGSWCSQGCMTSWECDWRAIGTEGTARWIGNDIFGETIVHDDNFVNASKPFHPRMKHLKYTGHAGCIDEFIHCVKNGGTPQTASTDNIYSLAMVEAAVKSAETGKEVVIDIDLD